MFQNRIWLDLHQVMITVIKPVTSNFITALPKVSSFANDRWSVADVGTRHSRLFEKRNQRFLTCITLAIHLVSTLQLLFTNCIWCKLGLTVGDPGVDVKGIYHSGPLRQAWSSDNAIVSAFISSRCHLLLSSFPNRCSRPDWRRIFARNAWWWPTGAWDWWMRSWVA